MMAANAESGLEQRQQLQAVGFQDKARLLARGRTPGKRFVGELFPEGRAIGSGNGMRHVGEPPLLVNHIDL